MQGGILVVLESCAVAIIPRSMQCSCGHMACIVVNRNGRTRCVFCDEEVQKEEA